MTAGAWVAIALLAICAAASMIASFVWERRARQADAEVERLMADMDLLREAGVVLFPPGHPVFRASGGGGMGGAR